MKNHSLLAITTVLMMTAAAAQADQGQASGGSGQVNRGTVVAASEGQCSGGCHGPQALNEHAQPVSLLKSHNPADKGLSADNVALHLALAQALQRN